MTESAASRPKVDWLRVVLSVIGCLGISAASVGGVIWINQTEPVAQTINAKRKSAALVETFVVQRGTFRPQIAVLGTVQAAQEVDLSPRVSGQIFEISSQFVPGGMVSKGTVLLRIDPADFENELLISKSELEQAEASLDIESGRQSLAKKELKMLEGTIDSTNRSLVLRQPQIASIRAQVKAAQAAVQRAQLNLDRTEVLAPFDAQILTRPVNVGSQVSPGDELGRLVGIDEYWVSAAVPVRSLRWIDFAGEETHNEGSLVELRNDDAWGVETRRSGTVSRMIGSLDEETRLARVLITVSDPLGQTSDAPPLILGSLIDVEIQGRPIEDVVRLSRDYLRNGDTVWLMRDGELKIVETEVVFRDAEFVYIGGGLDDGDEVIVTTLATVADGVRLRRIDAQGKPRPDETFVVEETSP